MNTLSKETGSYYHAVMRDQLTDAVFSFVHDASYVTILQATDHHTDLWRVSEIQTLNN